MLKKIKWNDIDRVGQVNEFVAEARRMIAEYGWENETVFPYSFPVKITDMIDRLEDIWEYESSSKELIVAEVNGLVTIMNKWEEHEIADRNGPQVTLRYIYGTHHGECVSMPERIAKELIEFGFAEAV